MRIPIPLLLAAGLMVIIAAMAVQLFSSYVTPPDFSDQTKPFETKLVAMSPPRPGAAVKVGAFASAKERCTDASVVADVGEGFEVLSGETEWSGGLYPGDSKAVVFIARARGYGRFSIVAHVECRRTDALLTDTVEYVYDVGREWTTVEWRRL